MAEKILIDITGLTHYHENLKGVLSTKQDVIDDLADIRSKANAAAGDAAQALTDAKAYADSLAGNYDAAGSAAQALADAKADAAEKYQVKGDYEAAGAAADALAAAKTYADDAKAAAIAAAATDATTKANAAQSAAEATAAADATAKANAAQSAAIEAAATDATTKATAAETSAKGYADTLNTAMDARVKVLEEIDHEQLAADASAAAVATILDGAPEKFDTLKEVAEWISATDSAASAADLVTRVSALEAIDHEAYKAADETVLASAKSYADGLSSNYDAAGSAATAKSEAIEAAAADATAKANAAQAAAEATAAADAKSKADAALASAKSYADQAEADALADAKKYVDETFELLVLATDADIDKLFSIQ